MSERQTWDHQVVSLLEVFGDEASYYLVRQLLAGPATQDELEDPEVKGLDQSGVSRRLKALARLGLIRGGGRNARHAITVPDATRAAIRSIADLAEEINVLRANDLKQTRKELARDEL